MRMKYFRSTGPDDEASNFDHPVTTVMVDRALATLLIFLVAFSVFLTAPSLAEASADEMVVIRADANSDLSPGDVVDGSSPLKIPAGIHVSLVDQSGNIIQIDGPSNAKPVDKITKVGRPKPDNAVTILARLLQERKSGTGLGGESRSGEKAMQLPTPWAISVHRTGQACATSERVTFWRSDTTRKGRLVIHMDSGGKKARVSFVKGVDLLPVPASMFADGKTYKITMDKQPFELTMHISPASAVSAVDQAVWMAKVGCTVQALALIDAIE